MCSIRTMTATVLFIVMIASIAGPAEGPSKDPRLNALKEQKETIDAQKGIVEAQKQLLEEQKKLIDASFPSLGDKGKAGSITQGQNAVAPMYAQFHAYRAAYEAAKTICAALNVPSSSKPTLVVAITDGDLATILRYQWVIGAIIRLTDELQKLTPAQPEEAGPAATLYPYLAATALTTIADFGRLFRTDKKIFSEAPTLDVQDVARMIGGCATKEISVTTVDSVSSVAFEMKNSDLMKAVGQLDSARDAAMSAVRDSARAKMTLAAAEKSPKDKKLMELADARKHTVLDDTQASTIQELDKHAAKLVASIFEPDDASKSPIIGQLLVGEVLAKAGVAATRRVVVHKVSVGGSSLISQSIWRSDRLYSGGGVYVAFSVTDSEGKVVTVGSLTCETPYVEVEQVRHPGKDSIGTVTTASCR